MDLDDLLNTVSGVEREAIENLCERAGTWDADWSVLKAAGEMIAEKPRLPRVHPENLVEGRWYVVVRENDHYEICMGIPCEDKYGNWSIKLMGEAGTHVNPKAFGPLPEYELEDA